MIDVLGTPGVPLRIVRTVLAGLSAACTLVIAAPEHAAARSVADPAPAMLSPAALGALQETLGRYETLVVQGGWPVVAEGPALRRGNSGERVALLRRRLQATGDLVWSAPSPRFDADVEAAVRRFQRRHGLHETGVVYRSTLDALNVTARTRLAQLRDNLAHARALAGKDLGERYVLVNIPGSELQAVSADRVDLVSRVIVGKPESPTPVLEAHIRSLTLRPTWRVPRSIVARDLIATIRTDRQFLARQRFRVFSAHDERGGEIDASTVDWFAPASSALFFRQDPGPENALGLIRINMPNDHVVLMHDTPDRALFDRQYRDFSAGCVRIERIIELADWLLDGSDGWLRERLVQAIHSGPGRTVKLREPVPVHFVYLTAWTDGSGTAQFRPDLYRHSPLRLNMAATSVAHASGDAAAATDPRGSHP